MSQTQTQTRVIASIVLPSTEPGCRPILMTGRLVVPAGESGLAVGLSCYSPFVCRSTLTLEQARATLALASTL